MPPISIVMPVYNSERYIDQSVKSILSQTYTDFELIIINDGSQDTTSRKLKKYKDKRLILVENKINRGLVYSLNLGIEISRGRYIARMDADDFSLPERLETQFSFLEQNSDCSVVGSSVYTYDQQTGGYGTWIFDTETTRSRARLIFENSLAHPSVMIRKSVFDKYGFSYDPKCRHSEDYALWGKLFLKIKICSIAKPLLVYRLHQGQKSNKDRVEAIRKIRTEIVKATGIAYTSDEIEVHNKVSEPGAVLSMADLNNIERWFNKLYRFNENNEFVTPGSLADIIGEKFLFTVMRTKGAGFLEKQRILIRSPYFKHSLKYLLEKYTLKGYYDFFSRSHQMV